MSLNDIHSLSHSKWNCKYHIVFAPKFRRKVFYGEKKREIGKILRTLCEWKGVSIMQPETGNNRRKKSMPRPYSHACGDTAKNSSVQFCGISKREEHNDDLRTISRTEV